MTIDGEGCGETPDTPDEPKDPETPDTPDTPEEPEVGGIDGYTKVTNAASLIAGDKVVLYCDEAEVGVTGWNGNKDATVAASGWVQYVVEVTDGGFYLKDGDQYITGAESANHFKYGEKAVCGVSDAGVLACGTKFMYKNGDYYRMYTDKSSDSAYKPFYVYKAGAGSGNTPDTPDTPDTPVTGTEITGIQGADATYVADEEYGNYWEFNLYASIDEAQEMYMSPYLYVETYEAYGKTTLNGTYNIYYAEYWKNENEEDVVNTDEMAEEPVGTLTIKNTDNNGNYSFVGSFVGLDGKTYTLNQVVPVAAYEYLGQDEDGYYIYEDLTLSENGSTPDTPDTPEDMITCAEAAGIAVTEGYKGTENVTVYGYVVELGSQKVDDKTGRNKQTFWLSDEKGGEKQFQAYWAYVPDFFEVGDKVAVTGILQNYKGTIEIADGEATLLSDTSVEDVLVGETPIKVIKNGQLVIIRGENTYNVLGAQVK